MFDVNDMVKQRTTQGPILCSIWAWKYCEIEIFFIGDTAIGPLEYADDLVSINRIENDVLRSHESAIHFQHKKRCNTVQPSVKY